VSGGRHRLQSKQHHTSTRVALLGLRSLQKHPALLLLLLLHAEHRAGPGARVDNLGSAGVRADHQPPVGRSPGLAV
jgi:hypothetical protein